uniref:Uncharacterized protein n=1 Tax=Arion vulgaris TaxID=1028688 RepID=A0A0B7APU4_9EUPU
MLVEGKNVNWHEILWLKSGSKCGTLVYVLCQLRHEDYRITALVANDKKNQSFMCKT